MHGQNSFRRPLVSLSGFNGWRLLGALIGAGKDGDSSSSNAV